MSVEGREINLITTINTTTTLSLLWTLVLHEPPNSISVRLVRGRVEDLAVSIDENFISFGIDRLVYGAGVYLVGLYNHRGASVALGRCLQSNMRKDIGTYVIVHFWKAKHDGVLAGYR